MYQIIDEEHLRPGDKLPPERELMEQLDVSRNCASGGFPCVGEQGSYCFASGQRKVFEETVTFKREYRKSQQKS